MKSLENKLQSIKMVAFDLFGVILTEGHLISKALMPLLPCGTELKAVKGLYEAFNIAQIDEAVFWSFYDGLDPAPIRQQLFDGLVLDPDYETVIKTLQPHYELSILSNVPSDWADVLTHQFNLAGTFSHCLFSGHEQCKKPDPKIYLNLIRQSGYAAEEIVFIDDRLANLHTAAQLGMATVYYQREQDKYSYTPDFIIERLSAITDIVAVSEPVLCVSG